MVPWIWGASVLRGDNRFRCHSAVVDWGSARWALVAITATSRHHEEGDLMILRRWRQRRRARLSAPHIAAVEQALTWAGAKPHRTTCTCVGRVIAHRQQARHGLKAYVTWLPGGETTGVWFEGARPPVGSLVVATGNLGWGDHHSENVFYVAAGCAWFVPARSVHIHERARRLPPPVSSLPSPARPSK